MGINNKNWTQTSLVAKKKALRLIDKSHYIAHTEPIFKKLHMVKIIDMFSIAVWKFYYKLMNDRSASSLL